MRVGQVIGTVVASIYEKGLHGGKLVVVSPLNRKQLEDFSAGREPEGLSELPSLVVWDDLGAGEGQIIGFVEGAEATAPYDFPIPIDALCVAMIDQLFYQPLPLSGQG